MKASLAARAFFSFLLFSSPAVSNYSMPPPVPETPRPEAIHHPREIPAPKSASLAKVFEPEIHFGMASWYSESDPGINLHTASGEVFDDTELTCASWDFPFNTLLKITNENNGKSVVCRVNDRGPAKRLNRLIDLTQAAFRKIAPLSQGVVHIKIQKLSRTIKPS